MVWSGSRTRDFRINGSVLYPTELSKTRRAGFEPATPERTPCSHRLSYRRLATTVFRLRAYAAAAPRAPAGQQARTAGNRSVMAASAPFGADPCAWQSVPPATRDVMLQNERAKENAPGLASEGVRIPRRSGDRSPSCGYQSMGVTRSSHGAAKCGARQSALCSARTWPGLLAMCERAFIECIRCCCRRDRRGRGQYACARRDARNFPSAG